MTTVEILKQARALIEKGWCKGNFAEDRPGHRTSVLSPDAVSFCAIGALRRATNDLDYSHEADFLRVGAGRENITLWNDRKCRKQADVLAAYDEAIQLAEAQ